MEASRGVLFVSMPTLLDPSLAPAGRHIVHAFTPEWMDDWQVGGVCEEGGGWQSVCAGVWK